MNPILKISGDQTVYNFNNNQELHWPGTLETGTRLEPVAKPVFNPTFELRQGEKIFTIGSCFARNIEKRLTELGFNVPATKVKIPYDEYMQGFMKGKKLPELALPNSLLNKYVPFSILNELNWVFEDGVEYPFEDAILEVSDGLFYDPHVSFTHPAPKEIVLSHRKLVMDSMRELLDSRVVIITLGLVEAWWDHKTKLYYNSTPPISVVERDPNRFELHHLSYEQILSAFKSIYNILAKYCVPDFKILLTVSPVPLARTFSDQDILCVNTYSKSLLRAVAQQVFYDYENVDYFPSYESIMLSERGLTWRNDQRHVKDDMVGLNIQRMTECYLPATKSKTSEFDYNPSEGYVPYGSMMNKIKSIEKNIQEAENNDLLIQVYERQLRDLELAYNRVQSTNTRYLNQINDLMGI